MLSMKIPTIADLYSKLHEIRCHIAKATLSSIILDKAVQYCTSSSNFYFDDSPLFVFHYNLGNTELSIQFDQHQIKIITNVQHQLLPGHSRTRLTDFNPEFPIEK